MELFSVVDDFLTGVLDSKTFAAIFMQRAGRMMHQTETQAVKEHMDIINATKAEADKRADYQYNHDDENQYGSTYWFRYASKEGRMLIYAHHYSRVMEYAYVRISLDTKLPSTYMEVGYVDNSIYIEYMGNKFRMAMSKEILELYREALGK